MRDRKPLSQPSMAPDPGPCAAERMNAALVQLARLLGRQAARDWLSTDNDPAEVKDAYQPD